MAKDIEEVKVEKKIKCACPGCGIDFLESKGIKGDNGKLYCSKFHADIAKEIEGGK